MSNNGPYITLPAAPPIKGLTFRLYAGEEDLAGMKKVQAAVTAHEGDFWMPRPDTEPDAALDPYQDILIAEVNGEMIGYTWFEWWSEADGTRLYLHLGWVVPVWRHKGIGRAILRWEEGRIRQIASVQNLPGPHFFGGNADDNQPDNRALLLNEGYGVAFTVVYMTCEIPETALELAPLPSNLELRPVEPTYFPEIYETVKESFAGSRTGYTQSSYEAFLNDLGGPDTVMDLWIAAWDGERIAGLVLSSAEGEIARTPWVAVRPAYRQQGIGKALMTRTVRLFQEQGLKKAELSTIAENPGKSVHLYESVGYQVVSRQPRYRKPLDLFGKSKN